MPNKRSSNVCNPGRPCISNLLDLLNELAACDLSRANPVLRVDRDWGVLIWVIESRCGHKRSEDTVWVESLLTDF